VTVSQQVMLWLLVLMVLASALGVVFTKHQSRKLFVELQVLSAERDAFGVEWGRLMLEQYTLATPNRVEDIARKRLAMNFPALENIVIVKP